MKENVYFIDFFEKDIKINILLLKSLKNIEILIQELEKK